MVAARPSPPHAPATPERVRDPDSALFDAIARYIRGEDRSALLQYAFMGAVTAVVATLGGASWWPWTVPLLMLGAGGVWGLADRAIAALRERRTGARAPIVILTIVRGASALFGAAIGLFAAAVLLAGLFGRVIS